MYGAVRRYQFDPRNSEEIDRKVSELFVPLLKKTPGFVAYYWVDNGNGMGASMSVFKDEAGAKESIHIAADFVQRELASMLGKPEVIEGEVKASAQLERA